MNLTDLQFIIPRNEKDVDDYYRIRYEVLRKPWGEPYASVKDQWEEQSLHLLVRAADGTAIATGRLQFNSPTEAQIRSMAVTESQRGSGIGSRILVFLEKEAIKKKIASIVLDARDNAVPFYLKNGYSVEGESYILFGVIPHFRMVKRLKVSEPSSG